MLENKCGLRRGGPADAMAVGCFYGDQGLMKAEEKVPEQYIIRRGPNCINEPAEQSGPEHAGTRRADAGIRHHGVVITILLGMGWPPCCACPKTGGASCRHGGGVQHCSSGCPCQPSCSGTCASPTS